MRFRIPTVLWVLLLDADLAFISALRLSNRARLVLEAFNLFDAEVSDIDYFYASRLPGEPADGVEDIHTHPALPRSARLGIQFAF
jgi:hypothetical protein